MIAMFFQEVLQVCLLILIFDEVTIKCEFLNYLLYKSNKITLKYYVKLIIITKHSNITAIVIST